MDQETDTPAARSSLGTDAGETLLPRCQRRLHMGTKQVRLDEDVYEQVKDKKREDETFSEAIERLTSGWSLLDLAGTSTPEEAEHHRDLLEESEESGRADSREVLEEMDVDIE